MILFGGASVVGTGATLFIVFPPGVKYARNGRDTSQLSEVRRCLIEAVPRRPRRAQRHASACYVSMIQSSIAYQSGCGHCFGWPGISGLWQPGNSVPGQMLARPTLRPAWAVRSDPLCPRVGRGKGRRYRSGQHGRTTARAAQPSHRLVQAAPRQAAALAPMRLVTFQDQTEAGLFLTRPSHPT